MSETTASIQPTTNLKLTGPIDLFKGAWQIFTFRYLTLIGILFIPNVIFVLLLVLAGIGGVSGFLLLLRQSFTSTVGGFSIIFLTAVIFIIVWIVIQLWSQIALLYAIKDGEEGIGILESYKRGWNKLRSYYLILVISTFIVFGAFILFIIPGIVISIWFILAGFVLISEDYRGMTALLVSREYIKGRFWQVIFRLVVFGFLGFLIALLLSWIGDILDGILQEGLIKNIYYVVSFIINILIPIIFTAFFNIYLYLIYKQLKEIKGDVQNEITNTKRIVFIAIGIFGIVILIGGIILAFTLAANFSSKSGSNTFLPDADRQFKQASDTQRKSDVNLLRNAVASYYAENKGSHFPSSLDELVPTYISSVPVDPKTNKQYNYSIDPQINKITVCAQLELEARYCLDYP